MYSLFFKLLQKIMLGLACFWLAVVVLQAGVMSLWSIPFAALLFYILYKQRAGLYLVYQWLVRHKIWLVCAVLLFQISILLTAKMMIRSDAAVVFKGAFELIKESSISNYLTRNPNNLSLFLYERFFYQTFGSGAIWLLQGLNIFYVHLTALILYRTGRDFWNQAVGDMTFFIYMILLGFSPYFIAMYTDILSLPMLAGIAYLLLDMLKRGIFSWKKTAFLGILLGLTTSFRVTAPIAVIAFVLILALQKRFGKLLRFTAVLGLAFSLSYALVKVIESQQKEVLIIQREELSKGLLTFINLGLTFSGTNQEDMKAGLLEYIPEDQRDQYQNGMFANENEIKEIKRRLSEYTPVTFSAHLAYKLGTTLSDGTLGWLYTDESKQKSYYLSPLYDLTKDHALAGFIRDTVIYRDGKLYWIFALAKQYFWFVLALGLVFSWKTYRELETEHLLSLALFGGLLFLMIFEGGKTRYLIQFLPSIVLLASLGMQSWLDRPTTQKN